MTPRQAEWKKMIYLLSPKVWIEDLFVVIMQTHRQKTTCHNLLDPHQLLFEASFTCFITDSQQLDMAQMS